MNIGALLYPGCIVSGLLAFSELLHVANRREGKPLFTLTWLGLDKAPINLAPDNPTLQARLSPQLTLTEAVYSAATTKKPTLTNALPTIDALIVPGFWASTHTELQHNLDQFQHLVTALTKIPSHIQLLAYCSGVCWLAAAGKLTRKDATSTWWMADFLHTHYPDVQWRFTHTCIATAKTKNHCASHCITAAGVNGYLPIAQQLISDSCGEQRWRDIAEIMVIPRPEKKLQPFQSIQLMQLHDPLMRKMYLWIEQQAATTLSLAHLSNKLNMSERTLARKVKAATGLSCAQFMKLIKLHQASEQLIYSRKAINRVSNV